MGYKLSDIYLFSDFDGTLHSATEGIPQRNLDALQRFVQKGGHFGLATGRAPFSAKEFLHLLPINSPCLCVNGGAVYDMQKDEYIYTDFLPEQARDYIDEKGYSEYWKIRLGHFIGQEDHEYGDVSPINKNVAEPGMIFSIEPGIYLEGKHGVRIEDLVLVTEDGCELLNKVDKKWRIVG